MRKRLALALHCTVAELENRLSNAEYRDWMRYYVEEPWGTDVDDDRFGTLAALIVQAMGGDAKAGDFFPRNRRQYEDKEETDNIVLSERLKLAFAEHNISVTRTQNQPE